MIIGICLQSIVECGKSSTGDDYTSSCTRDCGDTVNPDFVCFLLSLAMILLHIVISWTRYFTLYLFVCQFVLTRHLSFYVLNYQFCYFLFFFLLAIYYNSNVAYLPLIIFVHFISLSLGSYISKKRRSLTITARNLKQ